MRWASRRFSFWRIHLWRMQGMNINKNASLSRLTFIFVLLFCIKNLISLHGKDRFCYFWRLLRLQINAKYDDALWQTLFSPILSIVFCLITYDIYPSSIYACAVCSSVFFFCSQHFVANDQWFFMWIFKLIMTRSSSNLCYFKAQNVNQFGVCVFVRPLPAVAANIMLIMT